MLALSRNSLVVYKFVSSVIDVLDNANFNLSGKVN